MNEETRRMLQVEILNECWHETQIIEYCDGLNGGRCKNIGADNRDFNTGQDLYDLYRRLVEKGEFQSFEGGLPSVFKSQHYDGERTVGCDVCDEYFAWLFHVDRIPLIAEWWKGRKND